MVCSFCFLQFKKKNVEQFFVFFNETTKNKLRLPRKNLMSEKMCLAGGNSCWCLTGATRIQ